MVNPQRILIVGGGIAGLSLLAALRRHGIDAELIERNPRWEPVGGGIAVQPNAMRVLDKLGVGEAVRRAGAVIHRWQFRDHDGDLLCEIALEPLWGEVGAFVGIERSKLHEALKPAEASCRLGIWATSVREENDEVVVKFSDGSAGCFDLVVGADGIGSAMRQLVTAAATPSYGEQMVWRSVAPVRLPDPDSIQFWLGDGCFFGLCPVGAGTYGFANVTRDRFHDPLEGRLGRLRRCFAAFGAPIQAYLEALAHDEQIHCGPIEWLHLERWHRGHVLLIGDAAHASSPMMGQGGSMAMEDALVLAETLAETRNIKAAIESFGARRQPRVEWVQQQSRAAGGLFQMPATGRNEALRMNGKAAFQDRFRPLTALP